MFTNLRQLECLRLKCLLSDSVFRRLEEILFEKNESEIKIPEFFSAVAVAQLVERPLKGHSKWCNSLTDAGSNPGLGTRW